MPDRNGKPRLQDTAEAALASDDGPSHLDRLPNLVEALES
jgi:hypothetical protein